MNEPKLPQPTVIVAGDNTIDWNLARVQNLPGSSSAWGTDDVTRACCQNGGTSLLGDLLTAMAAAMRDRQEANVIVKVPDASLPSVSPTDLSINHSYATYSPFPTGEKLPNGKPKLVWRVSQFLGVDRSQTGNKAPRQSSQDAVTADVLVFDDAALGFRDRPELWAPLTTSLGARRPWIVLKTSRPVAQGELWDHVIKHFADKLIIVMAVCDLRRSDVQISQKLSWERTAQDLYWELINNPRVNGMGRCAATIVSFDTDGAFLLTNQRARLPNNEGQWRADLFFDPEVCEGGWEGEHAGSVIGKTVALTAGIVRQLVLNPEHPNLAAGVQAGIAAQRRLFHEGYGSYEQGGPVDVRFPFTALAQELTTPTRSLGHAQIQDPVHRLRQPATVQMTEGYWTILEDRHKDRLEDVATTIVLEGLKAAIHDVPIGRFGGLQTMDRREIEGLHSIQNLLVQYCDQSQRRPLSIAVFGPPGSGKSFGVEQVAKSVRPGMIETKTFNLSQFARADELLAAFHQVRDIVLQGKLPLVFWDEFDTALDGAPLGWLRYFLAPMQDGSFQQGEVTHPIGKCIFVFAGGTSHQMERFGADLEPQAAKSAKVPDFVSRLKGFLNVLGPNRIATDKGGDPYYIIRRAILLRSIFERAAPNLLHDLAGSKRLNIDRGVLNAMLRITEYKHGVRSIESLVNMSSLVGHTSFQRSSLPSEAQLNLHVPGVEFLSQVQAIELIGGLLERLASAAHRIYREGKARDGWRYGPTKSETEKTHPLLVDYEHLPPEYQESNRATVRNIPKKLARAGYVMMPSRSNEPAIDFPGEDLEALAEYEHELWMEAQLVAGFRPGTPTLEEPLLNEYLVPWVELNDAIKQIDRDLVRGIPKILQTAGYAVVRVASSTREK